MFEQSLACTVSMLDRHDKFAVFFLRFSMCGFHVEQVKLMMECNKDLTSQARLEVEKRRRNNENGINRKIDRMLQE